MIPTRSTSRPHSILRDVAVERTSFGKFSWLTFIPRPTITYSGVDSCQEHSRSIPQNFFPFSKRSFGHLHLTRFFVLSSATSAAQTAVRYVRSLVSSEPSGRRTSERSMFFPRSPYHFRLYRPLPAVWYSATTIVPSGA